MSKSILQAFTDNTKIKHLVLLWIIAISKVNMANVKSAIACFRKWKNIN